MAGRIPGSRQISHGTVLAGICRITAARADENTVRQECDGGDAAVGASVMLQAKPAGSMLHLSRFYAVPFRGI